MPSGLLRALGALGLVWALALDAAADRDPCSQDAERSGALASVDLTTGSGVGGTGLSSDGSGMGGTGLSGDGSGVGGTGISGDGSGMGGTGIAGDGSGIGGTGISGDGSGMGGTGIAGDGSGIGGTGISGDGSGIGGTGIAGDGSGIGGTGIAGDGSGLGGTGIYGTVTGIGSVCVNGLQVRFDAGMKISVNGRPTDLASVEVGHVAWVRASADGLQDGSYRAESMALYSAVVGVIEQVDAEKRRIVVSGKVVSVPELDEESVVRGRMDHGFASLRPGTWVDVSGLPDRGGVIIASRVGVRAQPTRYEAPDLGQLIARAVGLRQVSLEGYVEARVATDRLRIDGIDVDVARGVVPAREVALGTRVRALGRLEADGSVRLDRPIERPRLPEVEVPAVDPDRVEVPSPEGEVLKPVPVTPDPVMKPDLEKAKAADVVPEILMPTPIETPDLVVPRPENPRPEVRDVEIPRFEKPEISKRPEPVIRPPDIIRPEPRVEIRPDIERVRPK
ncbi:DUF5666 domain-containing protein [Myxococcota bacterium]|nr:DUF5666 domain-containing protein [Myxococcota bacterium]